VLYEFGTVTGSARFDARRVGETTLLNQSYFFAQEFGTAPRATQVETFRIQMNLVSMADYGQPSVVQPICAWTDASRKFEIYLRPGVMRRLGTEAWVAFKRIPRRGLEIGGVLLGRADCREDTTTFWIEGFAAVESEHRSGPSYVLSESDLGHLEEEIRKNGSASIGIFRSQTRSEQLVIQEPDAALLERYFDSTDAVFLMVGPVPGKGALFIRANGNVRCVHEFPLESLSSVLKGSQHLHSHDAAAPPNPGPEISSAVTRVVRQLDAPKVDTLTTDPGTFVDSPEAPLPFIPHEHPVEAPKKEQSDSIGTILTMKPVRSSGVKRGAWIVAAALAVLLVTAALSVRSYSTPRSSAPASSALEFIQLGVERDGSSLRVHWDQHSPTLRGATRAVLHVQDGEIQVDRILTASDLSTGSVAYEPKNSELAFRLDVYSVDPHAIGLVQVMNVPTHPKVPQSRPAKSLIPPEPGYPPDTRRPAFTPVAHLEPVVALPIAKTDEVVEIPSAVSKPADEMKHEMPAAAPNPPAKTVTKSPEALDSPAPKVSVNSSQPRVAVAKERSAPIPDTPTVNTAITNAGPSVSILAEPVTGSIVGRAFGRVPLLGRLKHRDNVAAPVPVHQAQPSLKLPNQQHLTGPVSVNVKVDVAESGKVRTAEIVEYGDPPNFSLANAALAAARQWTFQPARAEDLPVSSQVVLHFRFNP